VILSLDSDMADMEGEELGASSGFIPVNPVEGLGFDSPAFPVHRIDLGRVEDNV
jgi:hypothetical protein